MVCCCGKLKFDLSHSDHGPKQSSVSSLIYVFSHVNSVGLKGFCLFSICCQFFSNSGLPASLHPDMACWLMCRQDTQVGFLKAQSIKLITWNGSDTRIIWNLGGVVFHYLQNRCPFTVQLTCEGENYKTQTSEIWFELHFFICVFAGFWVRPE